MDLCRVWAVLPSWALKLEQCPAASESILSQYRRPVSAGWDADKTYWFTDLHGSTQHQTPLTFVPLGTLLAAHCLQGRTCRMYRAGICAAPLP